MSDERRRQQRLEISRRAVELFRAQGLAATSGEQIAGAAGVSERTLWRYFRSKESCVEPLLTQSIDAFQAALRTWPPELELAEHLHTAYNFVLDPVPADIDAVLAVVRMTRDEPALRAVWLVLYERAESTFAEVLAERMGLPLDNLMVRVWAASMNAALRVATDDLAQAAADGTDPASVQTHRERLAEALRTVLQVPGSSALRPEPRT
ncbi:MAG: TetR family transcriptional regulator [Pseudonocardia sp.]|nr:TetR family transcriptional regulator [Pseudonocardia sp.]